MSPAYVIADIDVSDPVGYEQYKALSTAAAGLYGGRFVVRGGAADVLEGDVVPHRLVVIEFETPEAARRWYASPEYAAAREIRQATSSGWLLLVEGAAQPDE